MALHEDDSLTLTLEVADGEFKSIGDEVFANFSNAERDVNVVCIYQIHGFLDGENTQPATLLVLRFDVGTQVKGRRFDFFSTKFQIQKTTTVKPGEDVWIEDLFEPKLVYMSEVQSNRSNKRSIQPSLNVSPPAPLDVISGGLTWTADDAAEWTETYRYTLEAIATTDPRNDSATKNDIIYWTAEVEDKHARKSAGISTFQVAMLVGRKDQGDFQINMTIQEGSLDLWDRVRKQWNTVFGRETRGKKTTISPATPRKKPLPSQVDVNHLRRLQDSEHKVMKDLVFVGGPQFLKPSSLATMP